MRKLVGVQDLNHEDFKFKREIIGVKLEDKHGNNLKTKQY